MEKPHSFEEVFKDAYDNWIDDANIHRYEGAKGLADQVWQHQQAKVEELQKRVDLALLGINGVMRWIDEDAIDDADFIRGGVLSALRRLEQALKGEG